MKYFLLTDTHFGAKNSSMTWWKSMSSFIYNSFLTDVENCEEDVNIIHLGDVFDSRSTINTYIANGVRKIFQDLAALDNVKNIYVIGGNHDYYSPENNDHCSIDIVLNNIPKVEIVSHNPLYIDEIALLPWGHDINVVPNTFKYIFTHTDLITDNPKLSRPVFSGHIHSPYVRGNCRNLGSCFPLTFSDINQARYYYTWDSEKDELKKFPNTISIRFWRAKGLKEFDELLPKMREGDYIELYIKQSELGANIDRIGEFNKQFKNIWIIPQPDELGEITDIECDIDSIINQSIPEELKESFSNVLARI